jgi:hypothetical protein
LASPSRRSFSSRFDAPPKTFSGLGFCGKTRAQLDGGAPAPARTTLAELGTLVIRVNADVGRTGLPRSIAVTRWRPAAFLHTREYAKVPSRA